MALHGGRRARIAGLAGAGVACGCLGASALAQDTPPEIGIQLTKGAARVSGAAGLAPGPTTIALSGGRDAALLELKPSVGVDELRRGLRAGVEAPAEARAFGTLVAGGGGTNREPYRTTIELRARTYAVIDVDRRPRLAGTFEVAGAPTGVSAPEPETTFVMRDFAFEGPRTLEDGTLVRYENSGRQMHEAVYLRVKDGLSASKVARQIVAGKDPERAISGFGLGVGAVDRGTVNDVATRLRSGRYVLVCFLPDERRRRGAPHASLGMVKTVRVR